jgi:hypothetical protein
VCHLRRIARVTVKSIAYALAATLLATSAHAEDREGNFRRCDVTKSFSQGKVRISVGEMIELDILWNDGADLDEVTAADISVRIDNTPLPHPKPLKYGTPGPYSGMVYGFELGSPNAIIPALFRAKHLQISFPGKPERSVDLDIGAGRKALAFLKKCDKFWTCVVERGKPGKKKHCYVPRGESD